MAYWLFKEDPGDFSYADLVHKGTTCWDGVANNLALQHLRTVRKGDRIFCYLTGDVKAIVGIMEAASDPYPDPQKEDARLVVVDVRPVRALKHPVSLTQIKTDPTFADWELVKISRLSVMPVSKACWRRVDELEKEER